MTKCDYCDKKIGFFSVMYEWLDKEKNLAIHDKCLNEWAKKNPEDTEEIKKLFSSDKKILVDKEEYLATLKWDLKWNFKKLREKTPGKFGEYVKKHREDMFKRLEKSIEKDVEKNLNQNGKVEIPFTIDDIPILPDSMSKKSRYLCSTHPVTKEESIKRYEDEIEDLKKEEDFPYKENILKRKNDMLNYLKQIKT